MKLSDRYSSEKTGFHTARLGFILVEISVVLVIVMALAVIAIPNYLHVLNTSRQSRSISDMANIQKDIAAYQIDKASPPPDLITIGHANFLDPWNMPYQYAVLDGVSTPLQDLLGIDLNTDFDLYSKGPDKASNSAAGDPANSDDITRAYNGTYLGVRP